MDNDIQRLRAARLKRDALRARRTEKARRLLPHIVDRLRRLQAHFKPAAAGVRAELLQRRTDKADAGTSRILGAIYDESVRLSQTVNDFLDYARPRQPRQSLVDVNLVLDQVMAFLEGELGRHGVAVEREVEPGLFVRGDKDLLYRAFYNILVNGQQAMDGPGIVRIRGGLEPDQGNGPGRVRLEFLDSGPGFDPATLPSLLDPFFTTKDGGTGLGLPIVQSIIASHGGQIELENGPEGGALVRVLLPAADLKAPEVQDE